MIEAYTQQVESIAAELGCRVVLLPDEPGMMYVEEEPPRIVGATLDDSPSRVGYVGVQSKYLALLHELGHVRWGHTQGRPPYESKRFYFENGVLRSEGQAWEFALDNCLDPLSEATRGFMRWCYDSYIHGAIVANGRPERLYNGNRHHVEFVYDEPGEYVRGVLARLGEPRAT